MMVAILICDTTSDYTNLLVFAGCCKINFDKKDSTATAEGDRINHRRCET